MATTEQQADLKSRLDALGVGYDGLAEVLQKIPSANRKPESWLGNSSVDRLFQEKYGTASQGIVHALSEAGILVCTPTSGHGGPDVSVMAVSRDDWKAAYGRR